MCVLHSHCNSARCKLLRSATVSVLLLSVQLQVGLESRSVEYGKVPLQFDPDARERERH
jgi:hypothetical protein